MIKIRPRPGNKQWSITAVAPALWRVQKQSKRCGAIAEIPARNNSNGEISHCTYMLHPMYIGTDYILPYLYNLIQQSHVSAITLNR